MGGHARFSPSSGKRRLECPPSLLLEEQFPDEESPFAAEGSAGHAMAEYLINKYLKKRTKRPVSDYYSDELLEAVDDYVEYNIGQIEQAGRRDLQPHVELAPLRQHDTALLPHQTLLRLGLLHHDMVEQQHDTALQLLHQTCMQGEFVQQAGRGVGQTAKNRKGGLWCFHSPPFSLILMTAAAPGDTAVSQTVAGRHGRTGSYCMDWIPATSQPLWPDLDLLMFQTSRNGLRPESSSFTMPENSTLAR